MQSLTFNEDCLEGMKRYPDGFFSLAVVDPPYGGGFTEGGGCKGWFTKYHQDAESSQTLNVERERESRTDGQRITDLGVPEAYSSGTSVTRTGGTWAEKYGKKS